MSDASRGWSREVREPEADPIFERVNSAIAITERLNRLPYADQGAIRAAWAELTNSEIDPTFRLIPPVYSDQGLNIRIGRDVGATSLRHRSQSSGAFGYARARRCCTA